MEEEQITLSRAAKREIRKQMWKSIAMPAIPASIILFAAGFFWNDVLKKQALLDAQSNFFGRLQQLTDSASESTTGLERLRLTFGLSAEQLEETVVGATTSKNEIAADAIEVRKILEQTKVAQAEIDERRTLINTDDSIDKVTTALAADSSFKASVLESASLRSDALETKINEGRKALNYIQHDGIKGGKEISFPIEAPGLLFAVFEVDNKEGAATGGGQHTIYARATIQVNGVACANDLSAYYVWDGVATANASCIYPVAAGNVSVFVKGTSSYAATTTAKLRVAVLPISQ